MEEEKLEDTSIMTNDSSAVNNPYGTPTLSLEPEDEQDDEGLSAILRFSSTGSFKNDDDTPKDGDYYSPVFKKLEFYNHHNSAVLPLLSTPAPVDTSDNDVVPETPGFNIAGAGENEETVPQTPGVDLVPGTPTHLIGADTADRQNADQTKDLHYTLHRSRRASLQPSDPVQFLDDITLRNTGRSLLDCSQPTFGNDTSASIQLNKTYSIQGVFVSPLLLNAHQNQTPIPKEVDADPASVMSTSAASAPRSSKNLSTASSLTSTQRTPQSMVVTEEEEDPRMLMSEEEFEHYWNEEMCKRENEYSAVLQEVDTKKRRLLELELKEVEFLEKLVEHMEKFREQSKQLGQQHNESIDQALAGYENNNAKNNKGKDTGKGKKTKKQ